MPVVGIPRALAYYTYFPLWKTFLEEIGVQVKSSIATNKQILDLGVQETVTDACIPIKILHGHVLALKDKVDYIFLPRLVSIDGQSNFCPKFLGLPDMVRYSRSDLPPIISLRIKKTIMKPVFFNFLYHLGRFFQANLQLITRAYLRARKAQKQYFRLLETGFFPDTALAILEGKSDDIESINPSLALNLAVLGYPYSVYDPYISGNLLQNIHKMGAGVSTMESIPNILLKKMSRRLPLNLFWHYSNLVAWSSLHFLENVNSIDGIIHVSAFGCGPDAMLNRLLELEAKHGKNPFLTISIDEHSGEAGILTRLEAFMDMLKYQKTGLYNLGGEKQ